MQICITKFILICIALGLVGCTVDEVSIQTSKPRPVRVGDVDPANNAQFPDIVSLYLQSSGVEKFVCSAIVISPRLLLTAGHCVAAFRNQPERYRVEVGTGERIPLARVLIHPEYNFSNAIGAVDIAVVELDSFGFPGFSIGDRSFRAMGSSHPSPSQLGTAVGFGEDGSTANNSRRERLSGSVVFRNFRKAIGLTDRIFNEGVHEWVPGGSNQISCAGDSGGPLILGAAFVGIASFVSFSGRTYQCNNVHAAYYTSMKVFGDWVDEVRLNQDPESDCLKEGLFQSMGGGCKNELSQRVWSQEAQAPLQEGRLSWQEAEAYCRNSSEADQNDWRLPLESELKLFLRSGGKQHVRVSNTLHWAAETTGGSARAVNFENEQVSSQPTQSRLQVLCVR